MLHSYVSGQVTHKPHQCPFSQHLNCQGQPWSPLQHVNSLSFWMAGLGAVGQGDVLLVIYQLIFFFSFDWAYADKVPLPRSFYLYPSELISTLFSFQDMNLLTILWPVANARKNNDIQEEPESESKAVKLTVWSPTELWLPEWVSCYYAYADYVTVWRCSQFLGGFLHPLNSVGWWGHMHACNSNYAMNTIAKWSTLSSKTASLPCQLCSIWGMYKVMLSSTWRCKHRRSHILADVFCHSVA